MHASQRSRGASRMRAEADADADAHSRPIPRGVPPARLRAPTRAQTRARANAQLKAIKEAALTDADSSRGANVFLASEPSGLLALLSRVSSSPSGDGLLAVARSAQRAHGARMRRSPATAALALLLWLVWIGAVCAAPAMLALFLRTLYQVPGSSSMSIGMITSWLGVYLAVACVSRSAVDAREHAEGSALSNALADCLVRMRGSFPSLLRPADMEVFVNRDLRSLGDYHAAGAKMAEGAVAALASIGVLFGVQWELGLHALAVVAVLCAVLIAADAFQSSVRESHAKAGDAFRRLWSTDDQDADDVRAWREALPTLRGAVSQSSAFARNAAALVLAMGAVSFAYAGGELVRDEATRADELVLCACYLLAFLAALATVVSSLNTMSACVGSTARVLTFTRACEDVLARVASYERERTEYAMRSKLYKPPESKEHPLEGPSVKRATALTAMWLALLAVAALCVASLAGAFAGGGSGAFAVGAGAASNVSAPIGFGCGDTEVVCTTDLLGAVPVSAIVASRFDMARGCVFEHGDAGLLEMCALALQKSSPVGGTALVVATYAGWDGAERSIRQSFTIPSAASGVATSGAAGVSDAPVRLSRGRDLASGRRRSLAHAPDGDSAEGGHAPGAPVSHGVPVAITVDVGAGGELGAAAAPPEWSRCPAAFYDEASRLAGSLPTCDCGCGTFDPDCVIEGVTFTFHGAGTCHSQSCTAPDADGVGGGECVGAGAHSRRRALAGFDAPGGDRSGRELSESSAPEGWTCEGWYYDELGQGFEPYCDCDCGAWDSDCDHQHGSGSDVLAWFYSESGVDCPSEHCVQPGVCQDHAGVAPVESVIVGLIDVPPSVLSAPDADASDSSWFSPTDAPPPLWSQWGVPPPMGDGDYPAEPPGDAPLAPPGDAPLAPPPLESGAAATFGGTVEGKCQDFMASYTLPAGTYRLTLRDEFSDGWDGDEHLTFTAADGSPWDYAEYEYVPGEWVQNDADGTILSGAG